MFRSGITTTYTLYLWDPVRSFRFRWQMHVPIPANGKRPWPCFLDMNLLMTCGGSEIYSQKNSNNSILELPDPRMHPRNLNVEVMGVALMLIWGQFRGKIPQLFVGGFPWLKASQRWRWMRWWSTLLSHDLGTKRRWGQWRGAYRSIWIPYGIFVDTLNAGTLWVGISIVKPMEVVSF